MTSPQQLLEPIIRGMCNHPDSLEIQEDDSDDSTKLTLLPHTADYRIICGKQGRQIKALQFLAKALSDRSGNGKPMTLELRESFVGDMEEHRPFKPNPKFDPEACKALVQTFVNALFGRAVITHASFNRRRATLHVTIENEPDESAAVAAMGDVFYPYGYGQGCILKISTK